MQLVDDHVRKFGRAKGVVVPRISIIGAQNAVAVGEAIGRELARIRVALVAAAARADHPKTVGVAIDGARLETGPIPRSVIHQQPVVGLKIVDYAAKVAVQIERGRARRPDAEGGAAGHERGAGWRRGIDMVLCEHWGSCRKGRGQTNEP